jgi:hypothetical protein
MPVILNKLVPNNNTYKLINSNDIDWSDVSVDWKDISDQIKSITSTQDMIDKLNDLSGQLKIYEDKITNFYKYFGLVPNKLTLTGNKLNIDLTEIGDLEFNNNKLHVLLNPKLYKTNWTPRITDYNELDIYNAEYELLYFGNYVYRGNKEVYNETTYYVLEYNGEDTNKNVVIDGVIKERPLRVLISYVPVIVTCGEFIYPEYLCYNTYEVNSIAYITNKNYVDHNIQFVGNNTLSLNTPNNKPGVILSDINSNYAKYLFGKLPDGIQTNYNTLPKTDNVINYISNCNIYNIWCNNLHHNPKIEFITTDNKLIDGEIHTVTNFNEYYKLLLVTAYRTQKTYDTPLNLFKSIINYDPFYTKNDEGNYIVNDISFYQSCDGFDKHTTQTTFSIYAEADGITKSNYASEKIDVPVIISKSDNIIHDMWLSNNNISCSSKNISYEKEIKSCFDENINVTLYEQYIELGKSYKINIDSLFNESDNIYPYLFVYGDIDNTSIYSNPSMMIKDGSIKLNNYKQLHYELSNGVNTIDKIYTLYDNDRYGTITYEKDENNKFNYYYNVPETFPTNMYKYGEGFHLGCFLYYSANDVTTDRCVNPIWFDITIKIDKYEKLICNTSCEKSSLWTHSTISNSMNGVDNEYYRFGDIDGYVINDNEFWLETGDKEFIAENFNTKTENYFTKQVYDDTYPSGVAELCDDFTLKPQHDVVFKLFGENWEIPTEDDFNDLLKNNNIEIVYYDSRKSLVAKRVEYNNDEGCYKFEFNDEDNFKAFHSINFVNKIDITQKISLTLKQYVITDEEQQLKTGIYLRTSTLDKSAGFPVKILNIDFDEETRTGLIQIKSSTHPYDGLHVLGLKRKTENIKQFIDLQLPSGNKWATCNIGAKSPRDCGLYFKYSDLYGYTNTDRGFLGTCSSSFTVDEKIKCLENKVLREEFDYATLRSLAKNKGNDNPSKEDIEQLSDNYVYESNEDKTNLSSIPTDVDYYELFDHCNASLVYINTHTGIEKHIKYNRKRESETYELYADNYEIIDNVEIPYYFMFESIYNNNYITLPISGFCFNHNYDNEKCVKIWTSVSCGNSEALAFVVKDNKCVLDKVHVGNGLQIREVKHVNFKLSRETADLGLKSGTLWARYNLGTNKRTDAGYFYRYGDIDGGEYTNYNFQQACNDNWIVDKTKMCDDKGNLVQSHDVVCRKLQGYWKIPSVEDFIELFEHCNGYITYINDKDEPICVKLVWNGNYLLPEVSYNIPENSRTWFIMFVSKEPPYDNVIFPAYGYCVTQDAGSNPGSDGVLNMVNYRQHINYRVSDYGKMIDISYAGGNTIESKETLYYGLPVRPVYHNPNG